MNRYTQAGIIDDARQGKRVVVFQHNHAEARATFHEVFEAIADDEVCEIHRANGAERIDLQGGGSIHFKSTSAGRPVGLVADTVFVAGWNDLSHAYRDDLMALLAKRPGGELIRA